MISLKNLMNYTGQLATMVRSGLPIAAIMKSLGNTAPSRRLRRISSDIVDQIEHGETLAGAFRRHKNSFPPMFVSLIEAGEQTGHMDSVMQELSTYYRERYLVVSEFKWAVLQIGAYGLMCYVLIMFIEYVKGGWDLWVALKMARNLGTVILLAGVLPWVLYKYSAPFRNMFRGIFSVIPPASLVMRKLALYRFSSSMALGISAGMEIRKTIRFSAEAMENPMMQRRAARAADYIDQGQTITQALTATRVFPGMVLNLYESGEQSGRLFDMMQHVSVITKQQAQDATKAFATIASRLIYVILVVYIGYKVISYWREIAAGYTNMMDEGL